jgi:hypothetical protein
MPLQQKIFTSVCVMRALNVYAFFPRYGQLMARPAPFE